MPRFRVSFTLCTVLRKHFYVVGVVPLTVFLLFRRRPVTESHFCGKSKSFFFLKVQLLSKRQQPFLGTFQPSVCCVFGTTKRFISFTFSNKHFVFFLVRYCGFDCFRLLDWLGWLISQPGPASPASQAQTA